MGQLATWYQTVGLDHRYLQRERLAHIEVVCLLRLVDMFAGFQKAQRRRRFKKLAQAVDGFSGRSVRGLARTCRPLLSGGELD
jgi:hypothetical protein